MLLLDQRRDTTMKMHCFRYEILTSVSDFFINTKVKTRLFQHKLVPSHWRESMHTEIHPEKRSTYKSTIDIPIEPEEFHYISLEPQQDIANRRALVTEI